MSTASGSFTFSQLPIGSYTLTAAHPGFRPIAIKDIRLGVGDNRTLDFRMEVSSVETQVVIESQAVALETESRLSVP